MYGPGTTSRKDDMEREAIIFIGMQASGKSTFYQQRFGDSHVRINLDMLGTRQREQQFVAACLTTFAGFVVDNTNPTRKERERYIGPARARGFRVIAYYFDCSLDECLQRNRTRERKVPEKVIGEFYKRTEPPVTGEGYDEIHIVTHGQPSIHTARIFNTFVVRQRFPSLTQEISFKAAHPTE